MGNNYWVRRAEKRMVDYLKNAENSYNDLLHSYSDTAQTIRREIKRVFSNFSAFSGLSEAEAIKLLRGNYSGNLTKQLRQIASKMSDPTKRQELLNIINAPAYSYRIKRWENLQCNIAGWFNTLGKTVDSSVANTLYDIAFQAYYRTMYDLQKGVGYAYSFSVFPKSRIDVILAQEWSGANYSERIWENTQELAETVKKELLTGFMTGRSYAKTSAVVQEKMQSGAMQTKRLIRTEANYVANQAELDAYKESGGKMYLFVATLDLRTSETCRKHDGKRYLVSEAAPGKNYPPLHPWCRSTTILYISEELLNEMKRRAYDPKTGNTMIVPASMTYKEWFEKYVGKEKAPT